MAVEGTPGIGVLRERHLHASVKRWYAEPGDREEVRVDGYVIDLVRGDQLIEVQTRGFAGMKPKVKALLERGHQLRVVHPIAVDRWIVQVEADGTFLTRRRSPRHGALADIASELITFPELLAAPGFEIEVLLTTEEEYRHLVPGMCWRRRGWTVLERRLVDVLDRVVLAERQDLARLLPPGLPATFTTADLAAQLGRPRRVAQHVAYCLAKAHVIEDVGKRGHRSRTGSSRTSEVVRSPGGSSRTAPGAFDGTADKDSFVEVHHGNRRRTSAYTRARRDGRRVDDPPARTRGVEGEREPGCRGRSGQAR